MYQETMKTLIRKGTSTPLFTAALFTIAKAWKPLKGPLAQEEVVYVCVFVCVRVHVVYVRKCYSAIKKNELCYLQQHEWA